MREIYDKFIKGVLKLGDGKLKGVIDSSGIKEVL